MGVDVSKPVSVGIPGPASVGVAVPEPVSVGILGPVSIVVPEPVLAGFSRLVIVDKPINNIKNQNKTVFWLTKTKNTFLYAVFTFS